MVTDPIADLITQIKNASMVKKDRVEVPYSQMKHAIADVLVKKGYLVSAEKKGKDSTPVLALGLAYENGQPKVHEVKRISKPSRRLYRKVREIKQVRHGHGSTIISTPQGIMSDDMAREARVGGEPLFNIW